MNLDGLWQASGDVVSREVAGEMVLLDLASGTYFGLNRVGCRVWERLSESACSIRQLSQLIESEFDAPYEQIEHDILELTRTLSEKALIREVA
jgi:hypothetical protein